MKRLKNKYCIFKTTSSFVSKTWPSFLCDIEQPLFSLPISETRKKKKMKKKATQFQLNPNWAQFQEALKSQPKPSRPFSNSDSKTILGKRKERVDDSPSMLNVLEPVNDDCSVTDEIGMDCEMVGVGLGSKSALGRVTLINKWGNVIYDEFVRPVERVVDFRTQISGIRSWDLRKAKDFRIVQKKVAELIKGRVLVGHALRNDLKALLLSHPKEDLRDTSLYQPFKREEGSVRALRHLAAEFLGVEIQNGEHCPVEDARAAMLLYQKNRQAWERSVKIQLSLKDKQKKRGKGKKKRKERGDLKRDHAE